MSFGRFLALLGYGVGLCILSAMITRLIRRAQLALFPELLLIEQPEDRRATFWRATNNPSTKRWMVVASLPMFAAVIFGSAAISRACPRLTPDGHRLAHLILGMIAIGVGVLAPPCITRNAIRHSLRRSLLERGIAVCPGCGCDLRGRAEATCPRCGFQSDGTSRVATAQ